MLEVSGLVKAFGNLRAVDGVDLAIDAGAHILAGEFREPTDEYREIPERLLARGVISTETTRRLASLSGFRNILVHEYAEIDLGRVALGLGRLGDIEAFVADVEGWLARSGR